MVINVAVGGDGDSSGDDAVVIVMVIVVISGMIAQTSIFPYETSPKVNGLKARAENEYSLEVFKFEFIESVRLKFEVALTITSEVRFEDNDDEARVMAEEHALDVETATDEDEASAMSMSSGILLSGDETISGVATESSELSPMR
ncbi:hypothetical protein BCR41DRAFT_368294 [Lobosporangium transversale]|uniref:Uncharacterized protein n=1 Tax=Lobosporangium transversale TaxID=64571 RepID=A0A1Y2GWX3_9FUNG|nr:hypothetical protein BCR41DRAFT_368294 [Lobosporangium transversale]ORZ26765.1 hypothetical protein BCR41DRAFT_368294 [Lobosporangium transversale]|eukprot:XP_021884528.1 hypothetical protein BCR41DRAFT_368294 [Lobosporangium transversale]